MSAAWYDGFGCGRIFRNLFAGGLDESWRSRARNSFRAFHSPDAEIATEFETESVCKCERREPSSKQHGGRGRVLRGDWRRRGGQRTASSIGERTGSIVARPNCSSRRLSAGTFHRSRKFH